LPQVVEVAAVVTILLPLLAGPGVPGVVRQVLPEAAREVLEVVAAVPSLVEAREEQAALQMGPLGPRNQVEVGQMAEVALARALRAMAALSTAALVVKEIIMETAGAEVAAVGVGITGAAAEVVLPLVTPEVAAVAADHLILQVAVRAPLPEAGATRVIIPMEITLTMLVMAVLVDLAERAKQMVESAILAA
jgi:hypothetical protein